MDLRLWLTVVCFAGSVTLQAQQNPQPLGFVPVPPCRLADTRNAPGPFGGPAISGGLIRNFSPPDGACNIPGFAVAYSLNVTVVPHGPLGYLTIWPAGMAQPVVSTLNSLDGRIKANAAIVAAGAGGAISVFVTDASDVVLDINGYFVSDQTASAALAFYPVEPCRVLDTRQPNSFAFAPDEIRAVSIMASSCHIPPTARAYFLNFTAVPNGPLWVLTTWADGFPQPLASTLNAPTGTVVANAALVSAGIFGEIDVFVTNETDLLIDINGYFAAPGQPGGLSFYTVTPCRIVDTRQSPGTFGAPSLAGGASRVFPIPLGSCSIPANAGAYSLNATVVPSGGLGFLTLWPSQDPQPVASTLNSDDGTIVSNAALLPASPDGSIGVFASNPTDLILDINGYFAGESGMPSFPQPQSVQLTWNASVSPDIIGYNLYRGSVSGGPYTLINAALVAQTVYTDNDVTSGATYYYVVTAVNSSNVESAYSNQAAAAVP